MDPKSKSQTPNLRRYDWMSSLGQIESNKPLNFNSCKTCHLIKISGAVAPHRLSLPQSWWNASLGATSQNRWSEVDVARPIGRASGEGRIPKQKHIVYENIKWKRNHLCDCLGNILDVFDYTSAKNKVWIFRRKHRKKGEPKFWTQTNSTSSMIKLTHTPQTSRAFCSIAAVPTDGQSIAVIRKI